MSRGYRVTWVTVTGAVNARDELELPLSLLGILPEDEMASLLRAELVARGWKKSKDGSLGTAVDGVKLRLDADGKTVTATLEAELTVNAQGVSQDQADRALEAQKSRVKERLQETTSQRLLRVEPTLRETLNEALQRVYVEALRRKAASLGEIESIQETRGAEGDYEVTIKVKA